MNNTVRNNVTPSEDYSPPTFIGVALHIYGGKGHVLSYHKALGEAIRLNGWEHLAVISPAPNLPKLPPEWTVEYIDSGVLDLEGLEVIRYIKHLKFWFFIKSMHTLRRDFSRVLRKEIERRQNKKIIFLESFNPLQLIAIVLSLLFVKRKKLSVWLMYRGGPDWGGPKHRLMARSFAFLFRAMNPVIQLLVGKNNFVLLTDSEMLSSTLPKYYHRVVHCVPIPHTDGQHTNAEPSIKSIEQITCWWPGAPRAEKGLDIIQNLATLHDPGVHKLTLVVARSVNLSSKKGCISIEMIDDKLSQQDYANRFFSSDIILLPYDKDIYSESTSGIFTECIVAGVIPLVTKGTWMAYELEKMDLGELVLEWGNVPLIPFICKVAKDETIKQKVSAMRDEYRTFHTIPSFAHSLDILYKSSLQV